MDLGRGLRKVLGYVEEGRGSGCVSLDLLGGETWLGGKRTGCGGPKLGRGSIKGVGWKEARRMEKGRGVLVDNRGLESLWL